MKQNIDCGVFELPFYDYAAFLLVDERAFVTRAGAFARSKDNRIAQVINAPINVIPFIVKEKITGAFPASIAYFLKKITPARKCQK